MATVAWTGNTDGDWNTVTNWSTGALPNAGDDVIFNTTSRDVTVSSSVASTNYGSIRVLPGFTGKLGVSIGILLKYLYCLSKGTKRKRPPRERERERIHRAG